MNSHLITGCWKSFKGFKYFMNEFINRTTEKELLYKIHIEFIKGTISGEILINVNKEYALTSYCDPIPKCIIEKYPKIDFSKFKIYMINLKILNKNPYIMKMTKRE